MECSDSDFSAIASGLLKESMAKPERLPYKPRMIKEGRDNAKKA
jgi:hypothetical protein